MRRKSSAATESYVLSLAHLDVAAAVRQVESGFRVSGYEG